MLSNPDAKKKEAVFADSLFSFFQHAIIAPE